MFFFVFPKTSIVGNLYSSHTWSVTTPTSGRDSTTGTGVLCDTSPNARVMASAVVSLTTRLPCIIPPRASTLPGCCARVQHECAANAHAIRTVPSPAAAVACGLV